MQLIIMWVVDILTDVSSSDTTENFQNILKVITVMLYIYIYK